MTSYGTTSRGYNSPYHRSARGDAMGNPYETGLDRNPANYESLTPLLFIEWSAYVYPERTAVIHGARRFTWAETYARSRRLASALAGRGIGLGDTVALMAANTPEMYEAHFGVPMAGAGPKKPHNGRGRATNGLTARHGGEAGGIACPAIRAA